MARELYWHHHSLSTNKESVVTRPELPSASSQDEFVAVYLKGNKEKDGSLLTPRYKKLNLS